MLTLNDFLSILKPQAGTCCKQSHGFDIYWTLDPMSLFCGCTPMMGHHFFLKIINVTCKNHICYIYTYLYHAFAVYRGTQSIYYL